MHGMMKAQHKQKQLKPTKRSSSSNNKLKQGRIVCGGGSADDNGDDDASAGRAAKYTKPKANANDEKRQSRREKKQEVEGERNAKVVVGWV